MAINFLNAGQFPDNAKLNFGDSQDLEIYHDSSHSYIDATGTGDLYVMSSNDDVVIQAADDVFIYTQGGENSIICKNNAEVELYYDNSQKFETTNTGISITGGFVTTSSSDCAGLNMTSDIAMGSNDITDSNSSAGSAGQVLSSLGAGNGTDWINAATGTVTSVGITAGTGISVSGSPVTGSGSITVTNTAPATIDGSGSATRLAYWSDSDTLTSNAGLTYSAADHLTTTSQVRVGDGSKGAPSYSFDSDRDTGMYSGGTDIVAFSAGGNTSLLVKSNEITAKSDIFLDSDSNIVLDTAISSTQSSGTLIKIGSHMSALVAGNIYYGYNSMGSLYWGGADADSSNTENILALSVGTDADVDGMLLNGIYHKASHGLTVGEPIYLSTTPMSMTNTAPSGANDYVRVLGYALDSNHIYFCPDNTWVKIN